MRDIKINLSKLIEWISDDELAYEFPAWCIKEFNITSDDVKAFVANWKLKDDNVTDEDFIAICERLNIPIINKNKGVE